jgi:hypothetical protein
VLSVSDEPPDVAAEHNRVGELDDYVENPIVIQNLRKVYPGQDGQPPKVWARAHSDQSGQALQKQKN